LWRRADRQALLELLALSASGHERWIDGCAAASPEERIDFSERITWFGDILNIERGRSLRSVAVRSLEIRRSVSGSSQWGRVRARPDPAGLAWGGGTVATWTLGANQVSRVPESGWPLPLLALICWPDGGKTPRRRVEMAVFSKICYVAHNGATHLSICS
jgi:hypothetical protein